MEIPRRVFIATAVHFPLKGSEMQIGGRNKLIIFFIFSFAQL